MTAIDRITTIGARRTSAVDVDLYAGFPAAIDALAARAHVGQQFLRAAWFAAAATDGGSTLIGRRLAGSPIAAIPIAPVGPMMIGLGNVPGSYWPFRSAVVAADASWSELAAMLAHAGARASLSPMWRMGPVYADEPATVALVRAAKRARWTVLTRSAGRSFTLDLTRDDWPRKSTLKRLRGYRRKLEGLGDVRLETVRGAGWTTSVFKSLAEIEAASWVGTGTDGSGAKFLRAEQRGVWQRVVADPVLADALSATILWLDDKPIAFSFDLVSGDRQYAIASSFDAAFGDYRVGKIVTYHQLAQARASGVAQVDFGTGDSGYKREIGAEPSSEIHDYLFVRNRSAAALLRLKWESGQRADTDDDTPHEPWDDELIAAAAEGARKRDPVGNLEQILLAGMIAATSIALVE